MIRNGTSLEAHIRDLIAASGPMPVARYMELCLTHPQHGYYVRKNPIGRDGDFITAPEVSQMFGELIGLWAASVWSTMGMPAQIHLIELGPGNGTMMMDVLRAIKVLPAFYKAASVHLVEISPALREKQRLTIGTSKHVRWYDRLDDVPVGPSLILANEYFDALPVHQAVKKGNAWYERVIDVYDGIFVFGAAKDPIPRFDMLVSPQARAAPDGAIFEWRGDAEIMRIARRMRDQKGAALIVDYGHLRSEAGDTFQAVSQHRFTSPLETPGEADLTAHVDFAALSRAAESMGARAHGPIEQGEFLARLGIDARAQTLIKHSGQEAAGDIRGAVRRLSKGGPKNMGSLFKVLAVSDPALETLPAISDQAPPAGIAAS